MKSDIINTYGGLFSILKQFDRSGLRSVINRHRGKLVSCLQLAGG